MFESPVRTLTESQVEQMCLRYYNTDIHRAAFALPQFVKKVCSYMQCMSLLSCSCICLSNNSDVMDGH